MRLSIFWLLLLLTCHLLAQDPSKLYSVNIVARINSNDQSIELTWDDDPLATQFDVFRRKYGNTTWAKMSTVLSPKTQWTDNNIYPDTAYEYLVYKLTANDILGYGNVVAGIDLQPIHDYGTLLLLTEDSLVLKLGSQIERLVKDISADGWTVVTATINQKEKPPVVKDLISSVNDTITDLNALLLLGNIAVPYSGLLAPDGHTNDHFGAWPTDAYYADLDGDWTDKTVNSTAASRQENRNIPFDGKFDQTYWPSVPELIVGRIYLEKFTSQSGFKASRYDFYQRYLDRNHAFRTGEFTPTPTAIISNGLQNHSEGFASMAHRYFGQMVGKSNVSEAPFSDQFDESMLFVYGNGLGSYQGSNTIAYVNDFTTNTENAVFISLLGSYFGDWDSENNFLRAPLASPTPALVTFWSGRPNWYLHEVAAGLPIGYSLKTSQKANLGLASIDNSPFHRAIHVGLMGDPTLKLYYPAPVGDFGASTQNKIHVTLRWSRTGQDQAKFYIYRQNPKDGKYQVVSPNPVKDTFFVDSFPNNGFNRYQIRAAHPLTSSAFPYLTTGSFANIDGIDRTQVSISGKTDVDTDLRVFPNPSSDFIIVNTTKSGHSATFEITNPTGKLVLSGSLSSPAGFSNLINVSNLGTGCYVIHVREENGAIRIGRFLKI